MKFSRTAVACLAAAGGLLVGTAGIAGAGVRPAAVHATSSKTIVIGDNSFAEENILGELYSDVLSNAGIKNTLKNNLGARAETYGAMKSGALDLVPEYAGSLLLYLNSKAGSAADNITTDVPALDKALASNLTTLNDAPAVDTNVFAVTQATKTKYHLTDLSSLAAVASKLTLGAPAECTTNAVCAVGLKSVYGIKFGGFKALEEDVAVSGLKSGAIQVAELFSSDGTVSANNFYVLTDNKNLQPADHIIPVIAKTDDTTAVAKVINGLSADLTTQVLETLNLDVNVKNESAATVAKAWLVSEKLIKS